VLLLACNRIQLLCASYWSVVSSGLLSSGTRVALEVLCDCWQSDRQSYHPPIMTHLSWNAVSSVNEITNNNSL
jgi:hypothetical protein